MRHEAHQSAAAADDEPAPPAGPPPSGLAALKTRLGTRVIVLVGMMGAGKSTIGRRLAKRLGLDFLDADTEIERAAGMTIPEIFEAHGEEEFRRGERAVIARLLHGGPHILATGGGAFMDAETRAAIAEHGIAVWLKADLAVLMARVRKRPHRPLLQGPDPEGVMRRLLAVREPVYGVAPVVVVSREGPHEDVMADMLTALTRHLDDEHAADA